MTLDTFPLILRTKQGHHIEVLYKHHIEVLYNVIRQEKEIQGIKIENE